MNKLIKTIPKYQKYIRFTNTIPQISQYHTTNIQQIWPLYVGCGIAVGCLITKQTANRYRSHGDSGNPYKLTSFYQGGFESEMTKREACLILGVKPGSTSDRIKAAHKRLLLLNHPDKGGSTYIAAKLNEAKDLLLGNNNSRK